MIKYILTSKKIEKGSICLLSWENDEGLGRGRNEDRNEMKRVPRLARINSNYMM